MTPEQEAEIRGHLRGIRRRTRRIEGILDAAAAPPAPEPAPEPVPEPAPASIGIGGNAVPLYTATDGAVAWHYNPGGHEPNNPTFWGNCERLNIRHLRVNAVMKFIDLSEFHGPGHGIDPYSDINRASLRNFIGEATSRGITILLDPHDADYFASNPTPVGDAGLAHTRFYDEIASEFVDNPLVWIEAGNELFGGGPRQHGTMTPIFRWMEWSTHFAGFLYEAGWALERQVHGLPNWSQAVDELWLPENAEFVEGMGPVIWDWHGYGALGTPNPTEALDSIAAKVDDVYQNIEAHGTRVYAGEFGFDWNTARRWAIWHPDAEELMAQLIAEPSAPLVGKAVWHLLEGGRYSPVRSDNGGVLSTQDVLPSDLTDINRTLFGV